MQKGAQYWLRTVLIIIAVSLVMIILPVMLPFILAVMLTLILQPVINFLEDFGKYNLKLSYCPRWLVILPVLIGVVFLAVVIVNYMLIPLVIELTKLMTNFPVLAQQFLEVLRSLQPPGTAVTVSPQIDALITTTLARVGNYGIELVQRGLSTALSIVTVLLKLLLVPVMTFYMLKDGRYLKNKVLCIFPDEIRPRIAEAVSKVHHTLGGYLIGQLILAVNMFCITFVVVYALDLPYPLVLAFLAGVAEWIPIIGPFFGALPAVILASLVSGSLAVKVAVFYFIIQVIDGQIIMPRIMGRSINLHPLVILTVIFIGGSFYGVPGMMVAVPITAILQIVVDYLWFFNAYFKVKGDLK